MIPEADTLTEKTRERADQIFEGLRQRFPHDAVEELAQAPDNLRAFGAPDGTPWSAIKSPHGLMESAWPQLRDFFREKTAARLKVAEAVVRHERQRHSSIAASTAEATDQLQIVRQARGAFETTFKSDEERTVALDRFKPSWVSNAHTEPGRGMTILSWFEAHR